MRERERERERAVRLEREEGKSRTSGGNKQWAGNPRSVVHAVLENYLRYRDNGEKEEEWGGRAAARCY